MSKTTKPDAPATSPEATGSAYPWQDAYDALCRSLDEDASALEAIVNDEDSCCPARELRRERAAALRYALSVAENLKHWEW
jgi:hypothetical protein